MSNSRKVKFVALLAFIGLLTMGLTTAALAQVPLGVWPGQAGGDLTKTTAGVTSSPQSGSYSYSILGVWPGQAGGDLTKNTAGPATGPAKPSYSYSILGVWPGQAGGDLTKNTLGPKK